MNSTLALDRVLLQISIDLQPSIEVIGTHPRPFNVLSLSLSEKQSKREEYRVSLLTSQTGGKERFL